MASGIAVVPIRATVCPSVTEKPLRGSVETTTGMPRGWLSAAS